MIFEIIAGILGGIGQDISLNTRKIDKHIEQLKNEQWFSKLYHDEKYRHLFFGNRRIRKYLQNSFIIKRMINSSKAQSKFKSLLDKQLRK